MFRIGTIREVGSPFHQLCTQHSNLCCRFNAQLNATAGHFEHLDGHFQLGKRDTLSSITDKTSMMTSCQKRFQEFRKRPCCLFAILARSNLSRLYLPNQLEFCHS